MAIQIEVFYIPTILKTDRADLQSVPISIIKTIYFSLFLFSFSHFVDLLCEHGLQIRAIGLYCLVLKKVYIFTLNPKIDLQLIFSPVIGLQ